jgi:lysozyme family protein
MATTLTNALRNEYQTLFDTCAVKPEKVNEAESLAKFVETNRARYETVATPLGIPWFFVGVLQCMECDPPRFSKHLHNGDPLSAATVQVPAGRPKPWNPPNDWETSATDALTFEGFSGQDDWSLPAILFRIEKFNGFGYRKLANPINTPYLWSFSNQYKSGKFVADGKFSPTAVSNQCGAAVILRRLAERGTVKFDPLSS